MAPLVMKQTETIALNRLVPILVSCRLRQTFQIGGETFFTRAWRRGRLLGNMERISYVYNTVVLSVAAAFGVV